MRQPSEKLTVVVPAVEDTTLQRITSDLFIAVSADSASIVVLTRAQGVVSLTQPEARVLYPFLTLFGMTTPEAGPS